MMFYFSQQKNLEQVKSENTVKSLEKLEHLIDRLEDRVKEIEFRWNNQFASLLEKIQDLKVVIAGMNKDRDQAKETIETNYRHFAGLLEKLNQESQVKALGRDMYRVEKKKT